MIITNSAGDKIEFKNPTKTTILVGSPGCCLIVNGNDMYDWGWDVKNTENGITIDIGGHTITLEKRT